MYGQIVDRLRALPGVKSASASQITPVGTSAWNEMVRTDGFTPQSMKDAVSWANAISEGYFNTLGIPLIAGRDFDTRETPTSAPVAIVSASMAKRFFGSASAVGKRFEIQQGKDWSTPIEVVGVVGDTKYRSLRDSAQPIIYFPRAQQAVKNERMSIELHTEGPALAMVPAVKAALEQLDPRYSFSFTTLDRQLTNSMTLMSTIATLAGFFGALALVLATIGLYGIMAYSVARRRNEIGVRIALGAQASRVVRMVLSDVGRIVIIGVVLGTAASFGLTRLVKTFLYGVQPNDPRTLATSGFILLAVGLVAAAIPALRASRLDPVAALREE
jgi:putative ABC transport system permease protein